MTPTPPVILETPRERFDLWWDNMAPKSGCITPRGHAWNGFAEGYQWGRDSAPSAKGAPSCDARVPIEPSLGLLVSMAIRYDHSLGVPGYYDQFKEGNGTTHAGVLASVIRIMRQLHEEVVGTGFYKPEKEAEYAAMAVSPDSANASSVDSSQASYPGAAGAPSETER
jgi:hypothetical protein